MRVNEDEKWAEWNSNEDFYAEVRQMVEIRLNRGESKEAIRRLLQSEAPTTVANGAIPSSTPFTNPLAFDTIQTVSHSSAPPTDSPTTLFTPSTSSFYSMSNPSFFPPQMPTPSLGLPFEEFYQPATEIEPNFSEATTQDPWSSDNFPQLSFGTTYNTQTPLPPSNESFDPSGFYASTAESQNWYQVPIIYLSALISLEAFPLSKVFQLYRQVSSLFRQSFLHSRSLCLVVIYSASW
jgi:hypothetical protein